MGVLNMGGQRSGYPSSSDHHPQILDPSEFPSLSRGLGQGDSYHPSLPAKPYGTWSSFPSVFLIQQFTIQFKLRF